MIHLRKPCALVMFALVSLALLPVLVAPAAEAAAGDFTADVVYRSALSANGTSAPNHRNGISSWSAASEQADAGSPIRAIRMAQSPHSTNTRIFVTQGDDGWLDAYLCATTCSVTNDVGEVWSSAPGTIGTRVDIAYEQRTGHGLLVYAVLSTNATEDIAYRTFIGGTWSAEQYLDDSGHTNDVQYSIIRMAARRGSDEIGLLAGEATNNDVNAWIWDGNSFGSYTEITASALSPNRERGAIAWESSSGHLLAMAVDSSAQEEIVWKEHTTNWSASSNQVCGSSGNQIRWLSLKPNPLSTANDMVLAAGDDGSELGTCYWTGSAWDARLSQDTSLDATATRAFDFAWESSGSKGLLAYGTTGGEITYRTFLAPGDWGNATNAAMGSNAHAWVQLRTNPSPGTGAARILGAVLEDSANALGAVSWNETAITVIGADTFTADAGTGTYESFALEFRIAGTPGTGNPGGLPFTLPFGLVLDTNMLLIIAAAVGAIIVIGVVARRRRRRRRGGHVAQQPSDDQGFSAPEPPNWNQ